jgi:hypothetical protein
MIAFDPDPKIRWLFCLTHPDDELAIAAWMRRLAASGAEVFASWTHSNCEREREARAAMEILGVRQDRLRFFGATDGRVLEEAPELIPKFREWLSEVCPDRVVCGAFEQGHIDHDATHFIVTRSFKGPLLETPLYHTYAQRIPTINRFAIGSVEEIIELSGEERRLKTVLASCYPSQRIRKLLIWYQVWRAATMRPAGLLDSERLRVAAEVDYTAPALPPSLAARVVRSPNWQRWEAAMRRLRS